MSGFGLRSYTRLFGVCLLGFMLNTVVLPSAHADDDLLAQVLTSLKDANAEYVNRCSNEGYKAKQWSSETRCLQDGRVHLVYEVDAKTGEPVDTFGQADLDKLFKAINDGAQIFVKERNGDTINTYECAAAAVYPRKKFARCSTNDFNYPGHNKNAGETISKIWFTFTSAGNRYYRQQYENRSTNDKAIDNPAGSKKWIEFYSWYVRY